MHILIFLPVEMVCVQFRHRVYCATLRFLQIYESDMLHGEQMRSAM